MEKDKERGLLERRRRMTREAELEEMIRGTLMKRHLECSKAKCWCHRTRPKGHGPYYFLTIRRKDKSKHVYVPQGMVKRVREWVRNYDKIWKTIERITDINIKLIRIQGAKRNRG